MARAPLQPPPGFRYLPGHLTLARQTELLAAVLPLVEPAGWFQPSMPGSGKPLSIKMGNLGTMGWVSDRSGYRYQPTHPATGAPWPAIPDAVLAVWSELADYPHRPECCLVNHYGTTGRLGLHVDQDEDDPLAPVVSISLGDRALFRLGGLQRRDPTGSFTLTSGDVVVLGGAARFAYHGVDRITPGSSTLIPGGGRINLTLRRIARPA